MIGMFVFQQRLGFAVSALLFEVRLDRISAIVPDLRRWRESDALPQVLNPPDDVHIIAGLAKLRIEAVHLFQDGGVERHVAAGNVLGGAVVDHDVRRSAGRKPHAIGDPRALIGNQIRPAHARVSAAHQRQRQIIEPILIGFAVAVGVDDDFARGGVHADIPGVAQAHVSLPDVPNPREFLQNFLRVVGRCHRRRK